MKVVISGASGLIGVPLVKALRAAGHEVTTLVRHPASGPDEVRWDPSAGTLPVGALDGVDAVINLSGAGIADKRWTDDYKKLVLDSRVECTTLLATTVAAMETKPSVFLSGSAIGYYGDTGDTSVEESAPAGAGFLADVCVAWEKAAEPAVSAGSARFSCVPVSSAPPPAVCSASNCSRPSSVSVAGSVPAGNTSRGSPWTTRWRRSCSC